MKSKLFSFTAILFAIVFVTSCAKLDKVLVKKEGKWNVSRTYVKITSGTFVISESTNNNPGTSYTFEKDGTGTFTESGGGNTPFTWTADDDAQTISYTFNGSTTIWEVTEQEKTTLKVKSTSTTTTFGVVTTTYGEIDMTRAE